MKLNDKMFGKWITKEEEVFRSNRELRKSPKKKKIPKS